MARPRSYDTDAVLAAAARRFVETGYASTSLDDLSDATGLGRGSIYQAFGDKHGLFERALDAYCEQFEAAVRDGLAGADDEALDRIRGFLLRAARTGLDDRYLVCLATKSSVELERRDPPVRDRIMRLFDDARATLADTVRAAQRHGDLDPAADPEQLADLVFTVNRGLDVLSRTMDRDALRHVAEAAFQSLPRS